MSQWAFGRVNSFMRGGHSQDNDIKRGTKKRRTKKQRKLSDRSSVIRSWFINLVHPIKDGSKEYPEGTRTQRRTIMKEYVYIYRGVKYTVWKQETKCLLEK